MEMVNFDEEFQFALEMVILKRNKNGATLMEIRDDIEKFFDINSEAVWGYKCWEQHIKPMLTNCMPNISTETVNGGCVLYYTDMEAAIKKLSDGLPYNMELILVELNIDLDELKKMWDGTLSSQSRSTSSSQTDSIRNDQPVSTSTIISSASEDSDFYGYLLIGDNFFLEMVHRELGRPLTTNRLKQVGHCVSGQSIRKARQNIPRFINEINQSAVIINLGSIDLLQGRELVDMIEDMKQLCTTLCDNKIFPILTTLPPLANQMHDKNLEQKRKHFNRILLSGFDCIDIERCLLDSYSSRLSFDLYQRDAKTVGGTRRPVVLWNSFGRQRVLKMLKRKIVDIHG